MHVTATRQLLALPLAIAVLPTGELLVLVWSPRGLQLEAYDLDLGLIWSHDLGKSAIGLRTDDSGTPWVIDRSGVSAFNARGDLVVRRNAPQLEGMEVAAFARIDATFLFAYHHASGSRPVPPVLALVTGEDQVKWLSMLETDTIQFDRASRHRPIAATGRFGPTNWVCGYLNAGELIVSGDAVLAIYTDLSGTGVSIGYVVSLADGTLRYVTRRGPVRQAVPYASGTFLVGYEGFGECETVRYDAVGGEVFRWPSHGRYVVDNADIRVIETCNDRSLARIVRLLPDGQVIKGDLVERHGAPLPCVCHDGRLYFALDGRLIAARDLLIDKWIELCPRSRDGVAHTLVLLDQQNLYSTYATDQAFGLVRIRL
jgi:hypothetical protein